MPASDLEWLALPPSADGWHFTALSDPVVIELHRRAAPPEGFCRVYWGSHGCDLPRSHEGPHDCGCCECGDHHPYPDWPDTQVLCVAKSPYYGDETRFYGEDAEALGLRLVSDD